MEKRIELERRGRNPSQITELVLDSTRSTTIEGLTDEFSNLKVLSLNNVGLTRLKGFPRLPNLKTLEMSDNRITGGLDLLSGSPNLTHLNLSGNKISDIEALEPLKEFKQLKTLDLYNNGVNNVPKYRERLFKLIPSLKYLDGTDINDKEAEDSEESGDEEDDEEYEEDNFIEDDAVGTAVLAKDEDEEDDEEDEDFDAEDEEAEEEDDEDDEDEDDGDSEHGEGDQADADAPTEEEN